MPLACRSFAATRESAQIKERIRSGVDSLVDRRLLRPLPLPDLYLRLLLRRAGKPARVGRLEPRPSNEDTQMLAEDYLRMGIARAIKAEIREPFQLAADRTILVVGGGPSGMAAAREASRAGYRVVLVEKEAELGGWLRTFKKQFPKSAPYRDLEAIDLDGSRFAS